ncbi:hypothetical protein CC1G_02429 [Coprinopsis cinerea okayama7|uniref:Chromo domain-containing protein n=1 Tax=Coprinopsis cinerea (strain Okayama-7 / 130 / ATCC MYA-4618 / FGSC 9003) TaxID=240176 RepID=A8NBG9_COPC7|nr:hypothetical protein CC1G_02429 [Coprinopsis cinerea okayama7\|eukprot:XP_001832167.2 hypothetical protein CC1G_02429 [Coprinopsis cinerea okayama7\
MSTVKDARRLRQMREQTSGQATPRARSRADSASSARSVVSNPTSSSAAMPVANVGPVRAAAGSAMGPPAGYHLQGNVQTPVTQPVVRHPIFHQEKFRPSPYQLQLEQQRALQQQQRVPVAHDPASSQAQVQIKEYRPRVANGSRPAPGTPKSVASSRTPAHARAASSSSASSTSAFVQGSSGSRMTPSSIAASTSEPASRNTVQPYNTTPMNTQGVTMMFTKAQFNDLLAHISSRDQQLKDEFAQVVQKKEQDEDLKELTKQLRAFCNLQSQANENWEKRLAGVESRLKAVEEAIGKTAGTDDAEGGGKSLGKKLDEMFIVLGEVWERVRDPKADDLAVSEEATRVPAQTPIPTITYREAASSPIKRPAEIKSPEPETQPTGVSQPIFSRAASLAVITEAPSSSTLATATATGTSTSNSLQFIKESLSEPSCEVAVEEEGIDDDAEKFGEVHVHLEDAGESRPITPMSEDIDMELDLAYPGEASVIEDDSATEVAQEDKMDEGDQSEPDEEPKEDMDVEPLPTVSNAVQIEQEAALAPVLDSDSTPAQPEVSAPDGHTTSPALREQNQPQQPSRPPCKAGSFSKVDWSKCEAEGAEGEDENLEDAAQPTYFQPDLSPQTLRQTSLYKPDAPMEGSVGELRLGVLGDNAPVVLGDGSFVDDAGTSKSSAGGTSGGDVQRIPLVAPPEGEPLPTPETSREGTPVVKEVLDVEEGEGGEEVEELSAVGEVMEAEEDRMVEEVPEAEEDLAVEEVPEAEGGRVVEEVPEAEEVPAIEEVPEADEDPAADEVSAIDEVPANEEATGVEDLDDAIPGGEDQADDDEDHTQEPIAVEDVKDDLEDQVQEPDAVEEAEDPGRSMDVDEDIQRPQEESEDELNIIAKPLPTPRPSEGDKKTEVAEVVDHEDKPSRQSSPLKSKSKSLSTRSSTEEPLFLPISDTDSMADRARSNARDVDDDDGSVGGDDRDGGEDLEYVEVDDEAVELPSDIDEVEYKKALWLSKQLPPSSPPKPDSDHEDDGEQHTAPVVAPSSPIRPPPSDVDEDEYAAAVWLSMQPPSSPVKPARRGDVGATPKAKGRRMVSPVQEEDEDQLEGEDDQDQGELPSLPFEDEDDGERDATTMMAPSSPMQPPPSDVDPDEYARAVMMSLQPPSSPVKPTTRGDTPKPKSRRMISPVQEEDEDQLEDEVEGTGEDQNEVPPPISGEEGQDDGDIRATPSASSRRTQEPGSPEIPVPASLSFQFSSTPKQSPSKASPTKAPIGKSPSLNAIFPDFSVRRRTASRSPVQQRGGKEHRVSPLKKSSTLPGTPSASTRSGLLGTGSFVAGLGGLATSTPKGARTPLSLSRTGSVASIRTPKRKRSPSVASDSEASLDSPVGKKGKERQDEDREEDGEAVLAQSTGMEVDEDQLGAPDLDQVEDIGEFHDEDQDQSMDTMDLPLHSPSPIRLGSPSVACSEHSSSEPAPAIRPATLRQLPTSSSSTPPVIVSIKTEPQTQPSSSRSIKIKKEKVGPPKTPRKSKAAEEVIEIVSSPELSPRAANQLLINRMARKRMERKRREAEAAKAAASSSDEEEDGEAAKSVDTRGGDDGVIDLTMMASSDSSSEVDQRKRPPPKKPLSKTSNAKNQRPAAPTESDSDFFDVDSDSSTDIIYPKKALHTQHASGSKAKPAPSQGLNLKGRIGGPSLAATKIRKRRSGDDGASDRPLKKARELSLGIKSEKGKGKEREKPPSKKKVKTLPSDSSSSEAKDNIVIKRENVQQSVAQLKKNVGAGSSSKHAHTSVSPAVSTTSSAARKATRERAKNVKWPKPNEFGSSSFQREFIECDDCHGWYHYGCVGIETDDYRIEDDETQFNCPPCLSATKRSSRRKQSSLLTGETDDRGLFVGHTVKLPPVARTKFCARPDCNQPRVEKDEYFVKAIIGRRLNQQKKFEWLVLWDGYDVREATWQTEADMQDPLKLTEDFHIKAREEGLQSLLEKPGKVVLLKQAVPHHASDSNAEQ